MQEYNELMDRVIKHGEMRLNRTGVRAITTFGETIRMDISDGKMPLLQGKKIHLKSVVHELLWFLRGDTNVKYLNDHGVTIWDEWADENGELGPVYGAQWRNFNGIDQIKKLEHDLKNDPFSRRHMLTAWNVGELNKMALPPCHMMSQFYVSSDKRLSCQMYMRSCDVFLGLPFNIASYALLTHMLAHVCGYETDALRLVIGDAHVYGNHLDACDKYKEQYDSMPKEMKDEQPKVHLVNCDYESILDFKCEDFAFTYTSMPAIKAPIAI
jgi:thymidylate synthase